MTQVVWDKVFPKLENIEVEKVQFKNRFGITLVADLYKSNMLDNDKQYPAIAISGPFGACKEQVSGLYAMHMANKGYITLAFDPSFTGESGGEVRNVASPDINTEDFQAAVDFLTSRKDVEKTKISIIGICGFGGFALNAAAIDTRIKAAITSTAYDMTRVNANGYNDSENDAISRKNKKEWLNAQRSKDFTNSEYLRDGGVIDPLPEDAPQFVKDYYAYYKTDRGYHVRSLNSNQGFNVTNPLSFINGQLLIHADEIDSAVLMIHGEKAHSRYFSEDMFAKLQGENKQLMIIDDAVHVDLYDNLAKIPFDAMDAFLRKYL